MPQIPQISQTKQTKKGVVILDFFFNKTIESNYQSA
jgi:hypothetical protein